MVTCEVRSEKNVRMRAYGEVLSVHLPSRSWQLLLSRRETVRKIEKKSGKCARPTNGGWNQVNLTVAGTMLLVRGSLLILVEVEDHGIVKLIADPTILCLATLESASLTIDGAKMKNSTTLSFLSMLNKKMMRSTLTS